MSGPSQIGPSQIDLGVYHFDPDPGPAERPDPPGWSWPEWQRLRRVAPRRWLAALLVPVLLAAAASAPPRPPVAPLDERAAGPRVWLAWWPPGPPEVLGSVPADRCNYFTGRHLLCGVIDPDTGEVASTQVWRVG